ncbi:MAG: CYTH domain-containing protein, partial [Actinomycetota bacterium]
MAAKSAGTARYVEVERKFGVPESGGLPSFDGMSGVVVRTEKLPAQFLEAVYFDTAQRDMAANRIALRRRTGGTDAGWHLKLPSADGASAEARTEFHAALSDGIPEELRDMVLAIVRDRPLQPVARIVNNRVVTLLYGVDGSAIAEFCDDHVSASQLDPDGMPQAEQQWREWELELVDAGGEDATSLLDRLTNRVREAGGTPAAHGSKLAKVLGDTAPQRPQPPADPVHRAVAAQVAALLMWDRAVRADCD